MDQEAINNLLVTLMTDVADKARRDALSGRSDIASVFDRDSKNLVTVDPEMVERAIEDIRKATRTKEGARRLINGLIVVAKSAARITLSQ